MVARLWKPNADQNPPSATTTLHIQAGLWLPPALGPAPHKLESPHRGVQRGSCCPKAACRAVGSLDAGTGRRDRTQGPDTAQFPPFIRVPAGRPPTGVKSQSPGPSAGDGLLRQQSLGGGALAGQLLETLKGDGLSTERGAPRTWHSPPLPRGPEGPVRMT